MDRSTGLDQSHNRCRTLINHFIKELQLLDIWRELKPHAKAYSCYSHIFKAFSGIDYFLMSSELRSKIHNCFSANIVILDHAPCCLVYVDTKLTKDGILLNKPYLHMES